LLSIGFLEILMIAVLGLVVFGPEKLPEAIRAMVSTFTKAKNMWNNTRRDLEKELGVDEIRREIRNAQIMENLEALKNKANDAKKELTNSIIGDPNDPSLIENAEDYECDGDDHEYDHDYDDDYEHDCDENGNPIPIEEEVDEAPDVSSIEAQTNKPKSASKTSTQEKPKG